MKVRASTRVIALLGQPVAHSLSPMMQNAAFAAAGVDAVYIALSCEEMNLHALMRSLASNGGGGNVTVPHKALAARAAPGDSRVERLGVANVFSGASGELTVANTDVDGLLAVIASLRTAPRRWCVVGTGGSAKAVAGAALEAGAELAVRSRDADRAARFREWVVGLGVELAEPEECELVINATPLGLYAGDPLPAKLDDFPRLTGVVDLTYRPEGSTGFATAALRRGLAASDGREMLVVQGAAGWRHWFPGVEPPIEVMRAALAGRMA